MSEEINYCIHTNIEKSSFDQSHVLGIMMFYALLMIFDKNIKIFIFFTE